MAVCIQLPVEADNPRHHRSQDITDLVQVATVEGRLQKLESEGRVAQTIIDADWHSAITRPPEIALRGAYQQQRAGYDEFNNRLVSLTGTGPETHVDVFGSGFLASDDGQILTNHHVAEP